MCIPNLFSKKPIPDKLPKDMENVIRRLKKCRTKKDCVRKAYDAMVERFEGRKWHTWLKFKEIFIWDPNITWPRGGFIHCTNMNYLLRVLLIKSGKFTEKDIKWRIAWVYGFHLHQYSKIRVAKKKHIKVDVWGYFFNVPFGKYAYNFNCWNSRKENSKDA
jgi:hypothetical protein